MISTDKQYISMTIRKDTVKALDGIAKAKGISRNAVMLEALTSYIQVNNIMESPEIKTVLARALTTAKLSDHSAEVLFGK